MKTAIEILQEKVTEAAFYLDISEVNVIVEAMEEYAQQQLKILNIPVVIHWVSIADEIPPENKKVICWNGYRMVEQSWMQYTGSDEEWFRRTFTHWTSDIKPPCL